MDTCFDIFLSQNKVGTVTLRKQGLYYQLECYCSIPMKERFSLVLICGSNEINLGVCVPYEKGFGLKTRIKCAAIEHREPRFALLPKNLTQKKPFYPVFKNKPFALLDNLENGYFQIQEGQAGIVFRNQSPIDSSKPTGQ